MYDVFWRNNPTRLFSFEKEALSLEEAAKASRTSHFWYVNGHNDYSDFDFEWRPVPWEADQVHIFPSQWQKNGGVYFAPKNLDPTKMHWRTEMSVRRRALNWINYIDFGNWQADATYRLLCARNENLVNRVPFNGSFLFSVQEHICKADVECMWIASSLCDYSKFDWSWHPNEWQTRYSHYFDSDPYVTKGDTFFINKKLFWDQSTVHGHLVNFEGFVHATDQVAPRHPQEPLDVVFISNGESCANECWKQLTKSLGGHKNRVHRVDGINTRDAAYKQAAQLSKTDWFFAVFAKLSVEDNFPWDWQPPYLPNTDAWIDHRPYEAGIPKHYIFKAKNPLNGLEYGHMAMIAYHKNLVLNNHTPGLDFTLSQRHEVVPILSGTAIFNSDPWTTWRTAFREVIKLLHAQAQAPDLITQFRLNEWLGHAEGLYAEYCLAGADSAMKFYNEVAGDITELKKTYEWTYCRSVYEKELTRLGLHS